MRPSAETLTVIRASAPEHIEQARRLFLEYAHSLGFSLCFQGFEDELRGLPGVYSPPSGCLLLAHNSGVAVGCVALRQFNGTICEMKRLYVRPDHRGKGIGQRLVVGIIAEARAIGYARMRLDTIASSMQDAIAMYRRVGFREISPYYPNPMPEALYLELAL